jgi:hypothetical protein
MWICTLLHCHRTLIEKKEIGISSEVEMIRYISILGLIAQSVEQRIENVG